MTKGKTGAGPWHEVSTLHMEAVIVIIGVGIDAIGTCVCRWESCLTTASAEVCMVSKTVWQKLRATSHVTCRHGQFLFVLSLVSS